MKLNSKNSFLLGCLIMMFLFWIGIYLSGVKNLQVNKFWGLSIDFIALFGGILGLITAKHWGNLKSAVGKGIIFLSLGELTWAFGNFVFSYYVFFLNNNIPYPSIADIFFFLAVPLWITGSFYLSQATGVKFSLKRKTGQIYLLVLPILIFIISYYLLVVVAREGAISSGGGLLKVFLDFAYPIGDVIIVTIALLVYGLSLKYLGGRYRWPVFITFFGFVLMFFADFSFSYTTTLGIYYGGNPIDLLFVGAMFAMGFGISSLDLKDD